MQMLLCGGMLGTRTIYDLPSVQPQHYYYIYTNPSGDMMYRKYIYMHTIHNIHT